MTKQKISPVPTGQRDEYVLAKNEKRQPRCTYCEKPLDTIIQTQSVYIEWTWNPEKLIYEKGDDGGDADKPEHHECGARGWDFIDNDTVAF